MKAYIEMGVHFGDTHSFRDLNLVLAPFDYTPAVPKTHFIDIPGGDGSIDATEADGTIHYQDREFQFTFTVMPGDKLTFEERQTVVARALHGKRFEIVLDKDPEYFWRGRVWIDDYASNKRLRQIAIVARVSPYKVRRQKVEFHTFGLGNGKECVIRNDGSKTILPKIKIVGGSGTFTIQRILPKREASVTLKNDGTYTAYPEIALYPGDNVFEILTHSLNGASGLFYMQYQEEDL